MPRLNPDQLIGQYRVVRLMGEGGMGAVYEVVHTTLGRRAALKVLHSDTANDPQLAARFLQEAAAGSRVHHPGVVHIYEFAQTEQGLLYFVMEYLDGESLSARFRRFAQSPAGRVGMASLILLQQVARALAAVHKHGFIHRDLKPGNIMIVSDPDVLGGERAKVLDFGIAKSFAGPEAAPAPPGMEIKTRTGLLMGTPAYMPPEQWRSQKLDDKVDVYSLGVIAFEALAGQPPFDGADMLALGIAHSFEPPPQLAQIDPSLPPELCALVGSMLEKSPSDRPSMLEVADRLGQILGIDSGSSAVLRPATPLSASAKDALDADPPTVSGRLLGDNVASSPVTPDASLPPVVSVVSDSKHSADAGSQAELGDIPTEPASVPITPLPPLAAAPKQTASPTAPTIKASWNPGRWLPAMLLVVIAAAGAWAFLRDGKPKPAPAVQDLGARLDFSSPPAPVESPVQAPADLGMPPDLARAPDAAAAVEAAPARARARCVSRRASSCILTHMTNPELGDLKAVLDDNGGVSLCPGERLVIVGLPRKPRLLAAPSSLKGQPLDLFLNALRGLEPTRNFPVKVEIQCAR